jgi:hypothetical protein
MLVVRMDGSTMPSSFSFCEVRRQVRSKPPPGAAGAMHSGLELLRGGSCRQTQDRSDEQRNALHELSSQTN